jgi:hypothetical protein
MFEYSLEGQAEGVGGSRVSLMKIPDAVLRAIQENPDDVAIIFGDTNVRTRNDKLYTLELDSDSVVHMPVRYLYSGVSGHGVTSVPVFSASWTLPLPSPVIVPTLQGTRS